MYTKFRIKKKGAKSMSQYLTIKELSEMLKVSRFTINNWRDKGLPTIKIGQAVRFNEEAVKKWIEENNEE